MTVDVGQVVHKTDNYIVRVGLSKWESPVVPLGSDCYLIINRHTGVREGEGSVLGRSIQYAEMLEQELVLVRTGSIAPAATFGDPPTDVH